MDKDKKIAIGINVWSALLVICSVYQMSALLDYDHYRYLHQEYPARMIALRYGVSWAIKILGLISGIGVSFRKDIFRKTAIAGSLFTILTIHLKHTCAGFSLHTQYLDRQLLGAFNGGFQGMTFSAFTWQSMMLTRILDVMFAGLLIYFFTRSEVKKHFQ